MRSMHHGRKADGCQKTIVADLRKAGVFVSMFGKVDLVAVFRGMIYFMEVKNPDQDNSTQKLTKDEMIFMESANQSGAKVHVVRTSQEALLVVGAIMPPFEIVLHGDIPIVHHADDTSRPASSVEAILWTFMYGKPRVEEQKRIISLH